MRVFRIVASFAFIFSMMILPPAFVQPVCAAQVVTEEIHEWARQALKNEASLDFKPAANTVAVLYFQNRTRQPGLDFLEKGMTVMLMTDLAKLSEIQVVERSRLQALMQELDLGASGLVTSESQPRVGRLMGARYLVGGTLDAAPDQSFTIDSDVLNVPRNGLLGSASGNGTMDRVLAMEKDLLFEIVRMLRLDLTEAEKAELRKPVTTDIKALMLLVNGIDQSDQGDYEKAADNYRQALQVDPGLEPAQSALTELLTLRLIRSLPPTDPLLRDLRKRVSVNQGPIPDTITKRRYSEPASVLGPETATDADVRVQW